MEPNITNSLEFICVWKSGETIPFLIFLATNIEQNADTGMLTVEYDGIRITLQHDEWDYFYSTEIQSVEEYNEELSHLAKGAK